MNLSQLFPALLHALSNCSLSSCLKGEACLEGKQGKKNTKSLWILCFLKAESLKRLCQVPRRQKHLSVKTWFKARAREAVIKVKTRMTGMQRSGKSLIKGLVPLVEGPVCNTLL